MIFRKKEDLKFDLNVGDKVCFCLPEDSIFYQVKKTSAFTYYLGRAAGEDDIIFKKIGLDKWKVCERCYNYPHLLTLESEWPDASNLKDLKRLINHLYHQIELRRKFKSIKDKKSKCVDISENKDTIKRFGVYRVYSRKTGKNKPKPIDIRNIDGQIQIKRKEGSAIITVPVDMVDDIITALKMAKEDIE